MATSRKAARAAAKTLANPRASKNAKRAAASDLAQTPRARKATKGGKK